MLALAQTGEGFRIGNVDRKGEEIVSKFQDFASDEGVFDELFCCLRRNLNAKKSMRVESTERESGYSYEVVEDSIAQIAAARTLAQLLRLMPGTAAVTITSGAEGSLKVTAEQQVSELESIGVPKDEIAKNCMALLDYTKTPEQAKA